MDVDYHALLPEIMAEWQLRESEAGWISGMFFAGYALLEVPSNLIMHRVGARIWMARIMVTWGLISAGMMFVTGAVMWWNRVVKRKPRKELAETT